MPDQRLNIYPAINRHPVHASITKEQISDLVDDFYEIIRADARLGPIFNERLQGRWPEHLDKMKLFWASILLRTGEYKGKPVPAHVKLKEVESEDFKIWLSLFRQTANDTFETEAAALVIEAAERIAQSLWLAMFATPTDAPPAWMHES